jgi:glycosyltransferase involved in cell wall biosynthesis
MGVQLLSATPRVSIGIPIYNGEATIRSAIEPLLAQSFGDFELLVSDNASTDSTGEIVREMARHDQRIRYVRQPTNLGVNGNYSYVATAARAEFLKWASCSDWCAPTFLERCLGALDKNPDAVLAVPRTRLFEGELSNAEDYAGDIQLLGDQPAERFIALIRTMQLNNAMNGLIRLKALRRTRLLETYQRSDIVLMGALALQGKFLLVDEPLFYRRMEPATASALQDAAAVRRLHYPVMSFRALFQHWKIQTGWFRAAATAPVRLRERAKALSWVARVTLWDRQALLGDLAEAWRYTVRQDH